ncbi:MAG: type II secretion system F family protein [Chlamydiae bacterium]|nr:type II secretion system F family protein [Chlamydiota bacterium]MBI3276726.1 type II secretion system F family protein [Chlamydiota bacterium]
MPKFKYVAKGVGEGTVTGVLETESEDRVVSHLQKQGLFPIHIEKEIEVNGPVQKVKSLKIKKKEISQFIQQLYDLISSGVTLLKALELVQEGVYGKTFKEMLGFLIASVRGGQKFSDALKVFPSIFSPFFVNLVKSGEASGALDQVLMRLSDFAEAQEEIRSKVKAALAYPVFVCSVGLFVIGVLLTVVIPRMAGIFEDMGQNLPFLTQALISVSHGMIFYWWVLALMIALLVAGFRMHRAKREGHIFWDQVKIKIPFLGVIHRDTEIARFARTLYMLLSNGLSFVQSLEIVHDTIGNIIFREEIHALRLGVSRGERMRERLKKSKFLPSNLINMLVIGEESGQLDKALKRIAESYERALDRDVKLATSLLEPVMILVIGGIVGMMAFAILLPIFQINFLIR